MRYPGGPKDWIARDGLYARCLGRWDDDAGGLPAYESENLFPKLVLMENLVAAWQNVHTTYRLLPRSYKLAALLSGEGLTALTHRVEAWWDWRPILWHPSLFGPWTGLGSQAELAWRYGLHQVILGNVPTELETGSEKAEELLREHLSPQQRLEYAISRNFHVRGGATDNLYEVVDGDGFYLLDKTTWEPVMSYCLHTEQWLPDGDISLATKLALENAETEIEALENANQYPKRQTTRRQPWMERSREMERALIQAVPRELELV